MSFPSHYICVAAALSITAGVASIVGMIFSLMEGRIWFDLGFVGIPIGYGLLIGRSSSRKWALFFSGVGLIVIAGFSIWQAYERLSGSEGIPYPDNILFISQITLATATCLYVLLVLLNKSQRVWFAEPKANTVPMKGMVWAVVAVSFLLHSSMSALIWSVNETRRKSFNVDVVIVPFNAENGKEMMSLSCNREKSSPLRTPVKGLPDLRISYSATVEGMSLGITGVASRPTKLILSSDGFQDTPVTLDEETRGEIRVPMVPVE